jgi:hypothetical protein
MRKIEDHAIHGLSRRALRVMDAAGWLLHRSLDSRIAPGQNGFIPLYLTLPFLS